MKNKNKKQSKQKVKPAKPITGMKSPIDLIFSLGNKLSPEKKLDFTYYMIWILFTAFVGMFIANLVSVIMGNWYSLIWCGVGFAISTLQYFNLSQMHQMRKLKREQPIQPEPENKIENKEDMLKGFEDSNEVKGGK